VLGKERLFPVIDILDEREDFITHMDEHLICRVMFPVRPSTVFLPFKDGVVGNFHCLRPLLLERVHLFESVHEDEVRHLLDGLERV